MKLELDRSEGAAQNGVVLLRKANPLVRRRIILLAFGIPGVLLALVGAGLAISNGIGGDDGMIAGFLFFFGVTFAIGGVLAHLFMKDSHETTPTRLFFNNRRGALELHFDERVEVAPRLDIPYTSLDGFRVKPVKQSSDNRTWYVYQIMLVRKDGSQWHLWTESQEDAAEEAIEYMQQAIQWKQPFSARAAPSAQGSIFQVQQTSDGKSVVWNGQRSLLKTFLLCLMITNFDLLFLMFYESMPFFLVILFLVGSIFPMIYFGYRLTPRGRMYYVHLSGQVLRSEVPGVMGIKRQETPMANIAAVSFDLEEGQLNPTLSILTAEQRKQVREVQQNPMSMLNLELMKSLRAIHRIETGDLSLAELLELENVIEKEVQARTGRQPT